MRRSEYKRRRARALRDLGWGVLLSFLLAGLAYGLERYTDFGEDFSWITYRFLQRRLSSPETTSVRIVDISQLQQDESGITPRDKLRNLLNALANAHPAAIGVDVDFSPVETEGRTAEEEHWQLVSPEDRDFFEFCKNLGVPVYLGVYRTLMLPPETWLGSDEYSTMAAALIAPERAKRVFQSFGEQKGQTMSAAIGKREKEPEDSLLLRRVELVESKSGEILGEAFQVDYSLLEPLKASAIRVPRELFGKEIELKQYFEWRLADVEEKRILIGDVERASDRFENPRRGDTIPGVLIHAAAAQTLLNRPLYDLAHGWREAADLLLSVLVLSSIAFARIRSRRVKDERLLTLLTSLSVGLVLLLGAAISFTHVLWDGFLVVAAAVALHPFADKVFHAIRSKTVAWVAPAEVGE